MMNKFIIGFMSCALFASVFSGCSNDDILSNQENKEEESASKLAPLTITLGNSAKSSRVAISDDNGKDATDDNNAVFSPSLKWEDGDYVWAYSPDYIEGNTKGGYTKLSCVQAGSNSATFVAVGTSKYVVGKPLYIYYHGGNPDANNGIPTYETATTATATDSTIAYFQRPFDNNGTSTESSQLFAIGSDANKSLKASPYFVRSAYIDSVPANGQLPERTLQGRMSILSFRLGWGKGLVQATTTLLGQMTYKVTIGCDKGNGSWGFPNKVSLKHGANGKLYETVDSYGDPLVYTIRELGLLNPTGTTLLGGNGMVYVCIPAVAYKNLRIQVEITGLNTNSGVIQFLLPGLKVDNQVLTYPEDKSKGLYFELDPNNGGVNNADKVYGAGNAMKLEDLTYNPLNPLHGVLKLLGIGAGEVLGIYKGAAAGWATTDGSLIEVGK